VCLLPLPLLLPHSWDSSSPVHHTARGGQWGCARRCCWRRQACQRARHRRGWRPGPCSWHQTAPAAGQSTEERPDVWQALSLTDVANDLPSPACLVHATGAETEAHRGRIAGGAHLATIFLITTAAAAVKVAPFQGKPPHRPGGALHGRQWAALCSCPCGGADASRSSAQRAAPAAAHHW
jgi:hypothetical protein